VERGKEGEASFDSRKKDDGVQGGLGSGIDSFLFRKRGRVLILPLHIGRERAQGRGERDLERLSQTIASIPQLRKEGEKREREKQVLTIPTSRRLGLSAEEGEGRQERRRERREFSFQGVDMIISALIGERGEGEGRGPSVISLADTRQRERTRVLLKGGGERARQSSRWGRNVSTCL